MNNSLYLTYTHYTIQYKIVWLVWLLVCRRPQDQLLHGDLLSWQSFSVVLLGPSRQMLKQQP